MDHDVMHKDVSRLKKFMADAEEAVAFYKGMKAAGGVPAPGATGTMTSEAVDQIVAKVVEQLLPKVQDLTARVEALEQKPEPAVQDMSSFDERLNKLETGSAATTALLPQENIDRLEAMLTWFETNQEGLELLLSLEEQDDPVTDGTTSAGTASGGDTAAGGAVDGGAATSAGTDPAPAPGPADAGSAGSAGSDPTTSAGTAGT